MTVKRYRKKPVEVEAVQWTGENREEVEAFSDNQVCLRDGAALHPHEAIRGDWIVRSDEGTFRVVPAERFQATYEEVADLDTEFDAAITRSMGEDHRVEVTFDGDATYANLIHPETGCQPGIDPDAGEEVGDECWLTDWIEEHGSNDLLFGKVTLAVNPEWDGDSARLHVAYPPALSQHTTSEGGSSDE